MRGRKPPRIVRKVGNKWLKMCKRLVFKLLPFPLPTKFNALFTMGINIEVGYNYFFLFTQIMDYNRTIISKCHL